MLGTVLPNIKKKSYKPNNNASEAAEVQSEQSSSGSNATRRDHKAQSIKIGHDAKHNTNRGSKKSKRKANKERDRRNHMPATPENLPLLPKTPPIFPGAELAAMPPGEVTPMMVMMMLMIMLRGIVCQ
jgi:hypothetical protein